MRRLFVSGFPRALLSISQEKSSGVEITNVIAYTSCASRDTQVSYGWDIFARFKTMRRKQILASALGIKKENWG